MSTRRESPRQFGIVDPIPQNLRVKVRIGPFALAKAIVRNQAHRLIRGALRGGHRVTEWSQEERARHAEQIFSLIHPYLGDVTGKTGLEIGPGDNFDVCELFLRAGCRHMYAVEKFAFPEMRVSGVTIVPAFIEEVDIPEQVDFTFSNDTLEHVTNLSATMQRLYGVLACGGISVHSVDLRAHNVFKGSVLSHRIYSDWFYKLVTSHVETSNRVSVQDLRESALMAGFRIRKLEALDLAPPEYVKAIRPHLSECYREMPDDELHVLQVLLVLEKP